VKTTLKGIVHGRIIELSDSPGVPDGYQVDVTIETDRFSSPTSDEARAALLRSAGAWAKEGRELDEYLEWCRQQRKVDRPEIEP